MKRLSDAIDEGSLLTPQAFDASYNGVATCALQAACVALGRSAYDWFILGQTYLWTENLYTACPESGPTCEQDTVFDLIHHLNDIHRWPRPRIAAWLRTIEPAGDAQATEPAEAAEVCR